MGLSAAHVQARFESSCGLEPLFRLVDGSNNPAGRGVDDGGQARRLQPPIEQGLDSYRARLCRQRPSSR